MTASTNVRVGINLLWLAPGEVGGSEDYCIGLVRALGRARDRAAGVEVVLYLNREVDSTYPDLRTTFTTRVAPVSGRSRATRILAEHSWLWQRSRKDSLDLVHHLGGTMPFVRAAPGVVLVHDLQPWAFPANFSRTKRVYLRATVPPSLRNARALTTLSRWVQEDVSRRIGTPTSRMLRVPPGRERLVGMAEPSVSDDEVLGRFGLLHRPFLLYPAITYPHKNHLLLLRAFERVAEVQPDVALVLTGGAGPSEPTVRDAIARSPARARVHRLGRVTHAELAAFYRTTTALTFPSRYEGFGMPVLEVMGEGRPVLAADAAALPEVVGDGGCLLDPDDERAWADAIVGVLDDPERWRALANAATARASTFSWDTSVDALLALYGRRGHVSTEDAAAS